MKRERLVEILHRMTHVAVGVIGDYCLDAYWELDTGNSEQSLETGKPTQAVRHQRYSPGGAGNIASNLTALNLRSVQGIGVIGDDLFGHELITQLKAHRVGTDGVIIAHGGWDTAVYAKPHFGTEELGRIDFGRFNSINASLEEKMITFLRVTIPTLDALVINQQLHNTLYSDAVVESLNALAGRHPSTVFILDARTMSGHFTGMTTKVNAAEAARLCGFADAGTGGLTLDSLRLFARTIADRTSRPVFVTRGEAGILIYDRASFLNVPAIPVSGPTDTVGAGDTTAAALAAALAAGASCGEAGEVAVLAAGVTVGKLRQTGTATPSEILNLFSEKTPPASR